jgi:hypothetical protein
VTFAVGPHALAQVHRTSLALTRAGPKLRFSTRNSQLVLNTACGLAQVLLAVAMLANVSGLGVAQSRAGTHLARMFSLRVPEVPSIKSSILGGPRPFEAVV